MDRDDPRCPECDRPTWREGKLCHRCAEEERNRHQCPFCGSSETEPHHDTASLKHAVRCRECGARGPVAISPVVASALWQRRIDNTDSDQRR